MINANVLKAKTTIGRNDIAIEIINHYPNLDNELLAVAEKGKNKYQFSFKEWHAALHHWEKRELPLLNTRQPA